MTAPPTATRRIVTERRQRPLRAGIGLAIAAVVMLVIGGVLAFTAQALEVGSGERASIGEGVRFDAAAAEYSVVLLNLPTLDSATFSGLVVDIECEVIGADGTERSVDHDDLGGIRTETSAGMALARFDTVAGSTDVVCDWKDGRVERDGVFYAVGKSRRALDLIGLGVVGVGVVAGLIAVWLIIIGWRGRQSIRPA